MPSTSSDSPPRRHRVREFVCTYRTLRDDQGQTVRLPTLALSDPRIAAETLAPLLAGETVEVDGALTQMLHGPGQAPPRPIRVPIVVGDPESAPAQALSGIAARIAQQVSIASFARKEIPLRVIS